MNLQPSSVLGLPAHPLIVHLAVVAVPLAAVAFAAVAWRSPWRQSYAGAVLILAAAGAVATFLAAQSGEALQGPVRQAAAAAAVEARYGDHPRYGEWAEYTAVAFAIAVLASWLLAANPSAFTARRWPGRAVYVAGCLTGGLATAAIVLAGHSGAALVWRDLGTFAVAPGGVAAQPTAATFPPDALLVEMTEFRFTPAELHFAAGAAVALVTVNNGRVLHSFALNELNVATPAVVPGGRAELRFEAPARPGRYRIVCNEEGHEEEGMTASLVVN